MNRDDEDDYSDDEDMSWKVRRSCAKCLAAIVQVSCNFCLKSYSKSNLFLLSFIYHNSTKAIIWLENDFDVLEIFKNKNNSGKLTNCLYRHVQSCSARSTRAYPRSSYHGSRSARRVFVWTSSTHTLVSSVRLLLLNTLLFLRTRCRTLRMCYNCVQ